MKLKFVSTGEAVAGSLTGKMTRAGEFAVKAIEKTSEACVAALMIREGGMIGIAIVGTLALLKAVIDSDVL